MVKVGKATYARQQSITLSARLRGKFLYAYDLPVFPHLGMSDFRNSLATWASWRFSWTGSI
jgi:hypothetical protein